MGSVRACPESGALFLDFQYRGDHCREYTTLPDTASNRELVEKLLLRVEKEIQQDRFCYSTTFPGSPWGSQYADDTTTRTKFIKSHLKARDAALQIPLMRDFAAAWYQQMAPEWRPSYQETVRGTFSKYLVPAFGALKVNAITREQLYEFRADLHAGRSPRGGLSHSRINKVMSIMRCLLREAATRYSFQNPANDIRALRKQRTDIQPFTLQETALILTHIRKDYWAYVALKFYTGLRTGEINALRWRDIDFERGFISVRNTLYKNQLVEGVKTDASTRDIKMIPRVRDLLMKHYAQRQKRVEWVFTSSRGKPVNAANFTNRVWAPLLRYLDLPYRKPYNTRHTFACLALAAGETPQFVAAVLGHRDTQMVFTTYVRFVPNLTRPDGEGLSELLGADELSVP